MNSILLIKLAVFEDLKLFYSKALTSQRTNNDQQALSYYNQALNLTESIDDSTQDINQFQYEIFLNICDIYIQQYDINLANKFIDKALQIAHKSPEQGNIAQCSDRQGKIKRLNGDYDVNLLCHCRPLYVI